jgi:aminoglycoside phosphotransferase (APT) family kinase protein
MLVDDAGRVVAITDWEIGTLGDPLAELAYFVNGWAAGPGETDVPYEEGRLDEGYSTRAALLSRYEKKSGRSLEDLPLYVAFNGFKVTCIVQGVYARFHRGVRSPQGLDLDAFHKRVMGLARSAEITTAAL